MEGARGGKRGRAGGGGKGLVLDDNMHHVIGRVVGRSSTRRTVWAKGREQSDRQG